MKSLKFFLVFAMLMVIAAITFTAAASEEEPFNADDETPDVPLVGGSSRFLASKHRVVMTCNKYPRVCRVKGSPGPDCCKRKCVNLLTDRFNCGKCGKKCKYSEICCKGKCVNPMSHKKHCGSCNNKCKKGSSCLYGMCSYA